MALHGKRYVDIAKKFDHKATYPLSEAVKLVKEMATAKFNKLLNCISQAGNQPAQSDQQVRSTVLLPNGLGKTVRVLVFAEGEDARAAEAAGADVVADDEILNKIQKENWLEFDAALAVPSVMGKVGRVARILGPRGLMPNPKAGTVVRRAIWPVRSTN